MKRLLPAALLLAVAGGPAWAQAPCAKSGDAITLEGFVAEKRIKSAVDSKEYRIYLFRSFSPACVTAKGKDGNAIEQETDRFQLLSSTDPLYQRAFAQVSGGKVRVRGVLAPASNNAWPLTQVAVDVSEMNDLDLAGAPLVQPEVPVEVKFRNALLASGQVARFSNESSQRLAVTLEIFRPSTEARLSKDLVLDAGQTREMGEREGWAFVAGDEITLTRKGMKSVTLITP